VPNYVLVNWSADVVPNLPPPVPYSTLFAGKPGGSQEVAVMDASDLASRASGAWTPKNNVFSNHHAVCYARLLDPTNPDAIAITNKNNY